MATLATDTARDYELGNVNELPVIASDVIYEGSAVGDNGSGYARPLVAGDPFRGFAESKADNALGSAGDVTIRVLARGKVRLAIGSLAITDVGKPVYASDDNTFVLTQSTNSHIGRVHRYVAAGVGIVSFEAARGSVGLIPELTDSSGGTADGTIAAVSGSGADADINNNFADLAAKLNAVLRQIG